MYLLHIIFTIYSIREIIPKHVYNVGNESIIHFYRDDGNVEKQFTPDVINKIESLLGVKLNNEAVDDNEIDLKDMCKMLSRNGTDAVKIKVI